MVAELVPVPIQILSVKLRKKRVFPATPIHHAFQRAGMKETRVVFWFFLAQVIFSLLAYGLVVLRPPEVPEPSLGDTFTERVR
jgi:phospho-N-acetylmuramoyl-pentapeptide-transferase